MGKMNIRLHRWNDALELALKHQTHVDTVLAYRAQHLQQMKHVETNEQFKQWAQQVEVDWDTVRKKIAMEKDTELRNANGECFSLEHPAPSTPRHVVLLRLLRSPPAASGAGPRGRPSSASGAGPRVRTIRQHLLPRSRRPGALQRLGGDLREAQVGRHA